MIGPPVNGDAAVTRLYFGTAVVPARDKVSRQATWTFTFKALLGLHKLYARARPLQFAVDAEMVAPKGSRPRDCHS